MCLGNRVGMRTIMSGCVGDEEGVETGELDRKEMKGKEDRCNKKKNFGRTDRGEESSRNR